MKFINFTKKETKPALNKFRPLLFDIKFYWALSLLVSLAIFLFTALMGFRLFYSEYKEEYKTSSNNSSTDSLISTEKLKKLTEKRNQFINSPSPILDDPSI